MTFESKYKIFLSRKWKRRLPNGGHFVLVLTHWGRVTHICVDNLTIIGPDNGLSPGRRQAIIWTNAGILLVGPWGTNFGELLIGIHTFAFRKIHLKMSSMKWRPFCLGLNVLICQHIKSVTCKGRWLLRLGHRCSKRMCGPACEVPQERPSSRRGSPGRRRRQLHSAHAIW